MRRPLISTRRNALALLSAVAGIAALTVGFAGPAAADPTTTYVAVGSDTTQDVMDGFGSAVGRGILGSWDAVNPATAAAHEAIAPKAGCIMTRPNGSGEGVNALRKSLNAASGATQLADPPEPGCVDVARSSGGPAADPNGSLIYVPFALDAVATATGPATATAGAVATHITQADGFTLTQLKDIYTNCNPQTVNGVTYDPGTGGNIHLYIPQAGSGTRSFWATTMGFNNTSPPACLHDHSVLDPTELIEEHNGLIYSQDPDAFGPFSIAQWISQRNGHNDRRHDAALHNLNAISPFNGTPATGTLNTGYPITRNVFNVMLYTAVTNGSGGVGTDAALSNLFVSRSGFTSNLCGRSTLITSFGFATLAGAPLGFTCGQISQTLRAVPPPI
jgi:PBP superfamily domain